VHELEIRSATSIPADRAGTDDRALGVTVESVTLECGEDIAPRAAP